MGKQVGVREQMPGGDIAEVHGEKGGEPGPGRTGLPGLLSRGGGTWHSPMSRNWRLLATSSSGATKCDSHGFPRWFPNHPESRS